MFTQAKVFIIFLIGFFCFTSEPIQGEVLDADGDGVVGPHEVLELVRLWKQRRQQAFLGIPGVSPGIREQTPKQITSGPATIKPWKSA
ncbi:MAG: hypothetical protein H6751_14055 [Candidatus Omnitrophica bacterium]|nr:hypothetical protein [Candidatus Omnitrophota bacterium]